MRFWQLVRQSLASVARSRLRSILTILGISIASGALVSMVSFVLGLQAQVEAPLKGLGLLNNIEVRPGGRGEDRPGKRGEAPGPRVLDDAALDRFQQIRGVDYVYPDFRISQIQLIRGDESCTAYAVGLPREASLISLVGDRLVAGDYFSLGFDAEALLGEKLLKDLGYENPSAAVGDTVELDAAGLDTVESGQFEFRHERLAVRIVGVYRPPGFATSIGSGAVLLPVDTMRDLPGTRIERNLSRLRSQDGADLEGYPQVTVHTKEPIDVFRVEQSIRDMGYETRAVMSRIQEARRFFVFMEVLLTAVGTVGLVVAGLGIMNTLLMTVMERFQEIGIYKAIGASDGDVRILFLTEAAVLGVVGGLGGLVLARGVCWLLQWGINRYAMSQGVEGPTDVFLFPIWLLAGAVLYSLVISVISGLYPATRAARVNPIEALRGN